MYAATVRRSIPISLARPSGLRLASDARAQAKPGDRFTRLVVLGRAFYMGDRPNRSVQVAVCGCDCGEVLVVRTSGLVAGTTNSCGCLQREKIREVGYRNRGQKLNRTPAAQAKVADRLKEVQAILKECLQYRFIGDPEGDTPTKVVTRNRIPEVVREFLPRLPEGDVRHLPEFVGYAVSSDGTIFSCRTNGGFDDKWHALVSWPTGPSGYLAVSMQSGGMRYTEKVYRLVLKAFIGPPPAGCVACHCNGDTSDNRLDNLRWDSQAGNLSDTISHGTRIRGSQSHWAVIDEADARYIKSLMRAGLRDFEIARELELSDALVRSIRRGQSWKHVTL